MPKEINRRYPSKVAAIKSFLGHYEDALWFIAGVLIITLMFMSPLIPKVSHDSKSMEIDISGSQCLGHALKAIENKNNGSYDTTVHCADGTVVKIRYRFIER